MNRWTLLAWVVMGMSAWGSLTVAQAPAAPEAAAAPQADPAFQPKATPKANPTPATSPVVGIDAALAAYDQVLAAAVRPDGLVDYAAVATPELSEKLKVFLVDAPALTAALPAPPQKLAMYINLYNATVLYHVAARIRPGYSPADNDHTLFKEPLVALGGTTISLNDLENRVIRGTYKEPRVHAVLNCAAVSCPPLLPRALRAEDLDRTLDAAMRNWLSDETRNRIDPIGPTLWLSRVFEWFPEDFGGIDNLPRYVSEVLGKDVRNLQVAFLEYDWAVNAAPLGR